MIKNTAKKGFILVYTDEENQVAVNPSDLLVYVGTVIEQEDEATGKKFKKVGTGTPKKLGVMLSELIDDNEKLNKELNELKITNRKTTNLLIDICDILVNNSVINNLDIKSIKNSINENNQEGN